MALDGITNSAVQRQTQVAYPQQYPQSSYLPGPPVSTPAYLVNISPEAKALSVNSNGNSAVSSDGVSANSSAAGPQECQTCKNRKYVDRSNDPTVSFQSPTRLSPGAAESAVRAHELEHVNNEQAKAGEQGRKVVSQAVTIHYSICPECGRSYVAGGTTTTVTRSEAQPGAASEGSLPGSSSGGLVDLRI
ncbi:hypothetical protein OR1_00706 [Geobacter sp. OR-1]|uniref:hypothetical protein n=1 Tax=Geobacter sp. OR-1 TaxID=1266765 RepID=UPI000543CD6A|nr:hypothetical protein [Geobacter sp. OR-1]GAM08434.1 hypothetical protein OR1_00706 [Geobacter sp. OR-1]